MGCFKPANNRFRLRGRLRLRARARLAVRQLLSLIPGWGERNKLQTELDFWLNIWDAHLQSGHFWNEDVETLLREAGEWQAVFSDGLLTYSTIRQLEARAHGLRILKEVRMGDPDFFAGKTVVDIGPGAVGFLEASKARIGIAVEPLARELAEHRLLLPSDNAVYLSVSAEKIPLLDDFADVVVSRNSLDHVENPSRVVSEVYRILKPGGDFFLIVHLEVEATVTEPYAFTGGDIHQLVRRFETVREFVHKGARTMEGQTLAGLYRKPISDVERDV